MGIGYQAVDRKVIDYDLWFLPQSGLGVRGPRQDLDRLDLSKTVVCIGAAQTFGRFVHDPYASQIGRLLQQPVLNLGFSGAGPEFYLKRPQLTDILARAGTVIVQSMSARSVTAGRFRTAHNNGVLHFVDGPRKGEQHLAEQAYRLLRKDYGEDVFREQVAAVQAQWVTLHRDLAQLVPGRKAFLWMSSAKPGENIQLENSPVGVFPHFVSAEMLNEISGVFDDMVDCTFPDMPAQVLVNDLTGKVEPVFTAEKFPHRPDHLRSLNTYYATPELHDQAASLLCRVLLGPDPRAGG